MVWEKRYLMGGIEGWENKSSKDIIYVKHKTEWEVILNDRTIHKVKSELEANDLMDAYIENN